MKKTVVWALAMALVALGFGTVIAAEIAAPAAPAGKAPAAAPAGKAPAEVPPPPPELLDIKMVRLDGTESTARKEFAGKKAIISISQSACGNCQQEVTLLQKISKDLKGKVFVGVVMVDMDGNRERLGKFLSTYNVEIPAYSDPQFALPKQYGVSFTPVLLFLDKDGKLVDQLRGFDSGADTEMLAKVRNFVK